LNPERLTFEGMLLFLVHVAEALYGFCDRCMTERRPPPTLATGMS
jgi:hypothetical protein